MTLASELVLETQSQQAIGSSFYSCIHESSRRHVETQIDILKSTKGITKIRFLWVPPLNNNNNLIECEAVVTYACDGLVCIVRRIVMTSKTIK